MYLRFFLTFGVYALVLFLPDLAVAQGQLVGDTGGLVPCSGRDCGTCELIVLADRIVRFIIVIMVAVAVLVAGWTGFRLVISAGNQSEYVAAKGALQNVLIGIILILVSWLIVDTGLKALLQFGGSVPYDNNSSTLWLPWNQVQCTTQFALRDSEQRFPEGSDWRTIDPIAEDTGALAPVDPDSVTVNGTVNGVPTCGPSDPRFPDCDYDVLTNDAMNPIFDPANGGSSLVRPGAAQRMQETLNGPFATLEQNFGQRLVINDAIAKAGTTREAETPNSRHFFGDAIDISLAGLNDADRIRLFNEAKAAGFTGFGFGNNILHIDRRDQPTGWAYSNTTYGGQDVNTLINQARN